MLVYYNVMDEVEQSVQAAVLFRIDYVHELKWGRVSNKVAQ